MFDAAVAFEDIEAGRTYQYCCNVNPKQPDFCTCVVYKLNKRTRRVYLRALSGEDEGSDWWINYKHNWSDQDVSVGATLRYV